MLSTFLHKSCIVKEKITSKQFYIVCKTIRNQNFTRSGCQTSNFEKKTTLNGLKKEVTYDKEHSLHVFVSSVHHSARPTDTIQAACSSKNVPAMFTVQNRILSRLNKRKIKDQKLHKFQWQT